jgi:hypothetical protein
MSAKTNYRILMNELIEQKSEQITIPKLNPGALSNEDMKKATLRQICIWLSIVLAAVLYFALQAMINMPIQKNSILYAKYGTAKPSGQRG